MPATSVRISRRFIDGDCYEIRDTTGPDGMTVRTQSVEPADTCPKPTDLKSLVTRSPAMSTGGAPKWFLPVLLIGGAAGLFFLMKRKS